MHDQAWTEYQQWHLVGIKGVAMAALAQCLVDAGKIVTGADVSENFVTEALLRSIGQTNVSSFTDPVPEGTDIVVYTAAHQGHLNPQVLAASNQQIRCISHAEALGWLSNDKKGIAVCGVGGKSTTSAMIAWILEKTGHQPSYAIGVGGIPGLAGTGQWSEASEYFVAEADEYVVDPSAPSRGEAIIPRFSYLRPQVIVCTNLEFDHPDVYRDFEHTLAEFARFFSFLPSEGLLIANVLNRPMIEKMQLPSKVQYFGEEGEAFLKGQPVYTEGWSEVDVVVLGQSTRLRLRLPGEFNLRNALAAVLATTSLGVSLTDAVAALSEFRSTKRRAEWVGTYRDAVLYDDYAHHPHEVEAIIRAFREWYPERTLIVAFQSHTFSRTKALFVEFTAAFDQADEVCMIDIFPSAREAFDPTVTSDSLCRAINERTGEQKATNYHTLDELAAYLRTNLSQNDLCLSVGAGDIYQVYDHLEGINHD